MVRISGNTVVRVGRNGCNPRHDCRGRAPSYGWIITMEEDVGPAAIMNALATPAATRSALPMDRSNLRTAFLAHESRLVFRDSCVAAYFFNPVRL